MNQANKSQHAHIAARTALLATSRFISAACPLPRKYMYTCCIKFTRILSSRPFLLSDSFGFPFTKRLKGKKGKK